MFRFQEVCEKEDRSGTALKQRSMASTLTSNLTSWFIMNIFFIIYKTDVTALAQGEATTRGEHTKEGWTKLIQLKRNVECVSQCVQMLNVCDECKCRLIKLKQGWTIFLNIHV